jgi:hypothetical protein
MAKKQIRLFISFTRIQGGEAQGGQVFLFDNWEQVGIFVKQHSKEFFVTINQTQL